MQGFNMGRYVPPDLEGTTSFNAASGKGHALGARARKLKSEGILVVRFECPFAIWCTNCQPEQIIGQGVRFNAEKKKVGNYYSTPIWSFRFKHTVCGKPIEVHTDPKNAEYVVVEGGRRRDTGADKLLDGEIRIGATEEEKGRLEKDGAFGILEKKLEDKREADTQKRRLDELVGKSDRDWADPYEMSRKLRKEFRAGRRQRQADEKSGEALQDKFGLYLDMIAPDERDAERAALIDFGDDRPNLPLSRPMFEDRRDHASVKQVQEQRKRSKLLSGLPVQKGSIQDSLKANTRSALDPFLTDSPSLDRQQWRPKVKKQVVDDRPEQGVSQLQNGEASNPVPAALALVSYDSD